MSMQNVKLESILTEEAFRKRCTELELAYDIKTNGLVTPLRVEENDGEFILVEGYRRYFALKHIDAEYADCIVENKTSEINRVIKRLNAEFYQKKRTGYEMQRMVEYLLAHDLDEVEIAKLCNVTTNTIKKYIEGSEVNPEWLIAGEKTGAGKHGYTVIHSLKYLKGYNKEYINGIYTERNINGEDLKKLKKATKMAPFQQLSGDSQRKVLDNSIGQIKKKDESIKQVVYEQSLKENYSLSTHQYIFCLLNQLLNRITTNFTKNFTNYLTNHQRNQLYNKLVLLIEKLGMPIKWSEFPSEPLIGIDDEHNGKDGDKLEH